MNKTENNEFEEEIKGLRKFEMEINPHEIEGFITTSIYIFGSKIPISLVLFGMINLLNI